MTEDALTGLSGRAVLLDRIEHALTRLARSERSIAVLFLDLDRFKDINDAVGEAAGDRVLRAVADRLRACVRPSDTVARYGGDEFVVLCEGLRDAREADVVAARIRAALAEPVELEGRLVATTASIGVAIAADDSGTAERLLRAADAAMWDAKQRRRQARVLVCDDSPVLRILLREALEAQGFVVAAQASDGRGLVEAARAAAVEVLLLDLAMPEVGGLEALPALRAALPELTIVVVSGFDRGRMAAQALALGADAYVEKRAPLRDICAAVGAALDARRGVAAQTGP